MKVTEISSSSFKFLRKKGKKLSEFSNDNDVSYRWLFCLPIVVPDPFEYLFQSHWIGKGYYKRGPDGNDIHKTNVPHIRVEFRDTVWFQLWFHAFLLI